MGALHRLGGDAHLVEAVVVAVEGGGVVRPDFLEDLYLLVDEGAAVVEGAELEVLELILHPADADAELHASARKLVDGGDDLGGVHGVAVGQDDDAAANLDGARAGGGVGEDGEGVPPRSLASHPLAGDVVGVLRADAVGKEDVVDDPDGVEAGRLGPVAHGIDRVGSGEGADHGEDHAKLHSRHGRNDTLEVEVNPDRVVDLGHEIGGNMADSRAEACDGDRANLVRLRH